MKQMQLALVAGVILMLASLNAPALTLEHFWQETLDHDPQVQLYRQQLEVASQSQPLALAKLLPQISVHASAQWDNHRIQKPYDKYDPNSVLFSRGRHNIIQRWSAQISQTLFNWSALQNYRASGDQVAAAAAQYQESVQKLERSAIVAYGNWLLAYANLQNLKASEKGVARQAYAAEARYRSGTTGILGADEAKVALARIRAQLAQALAKWHGAGAVLEQFTGKKSPPEAPKLPQIIHLPIHLEKQWQALALIHNPALASARYQLDASRKGVAAAQGGFLPTLTLVLAHQWMSENGTLYFQGAQEGAGTSGSGIPDPHHYIGTSATIQMNWAIFSGGSQQATLAEAQYQEGESFSTLLTTERSIEQILRTSSSGLSGSLQQAKIYRYSLALAKRASRAAEDGVRVGLVTENNAIIDRQNALKVRNDLNDVNASALIQFANLATAAGVLTPVLMHQISLSLSLGGNYAKIP
ncbi:MULTISPECIES: TolC family protein [Acidithiobacillus]|uniref:Outer membrane protein TolC n=1 Tax=Acidithiobacillus thiooxidans ATCC 19377 TaxID=637390 RepID=A0A5P9XTJ6_ACITH|nr:TolC family protein [Acidithiobacillus thiooxidans]MBU2837617.1 TolC family protein [Acidithiobacillus thiooxidans]QFX96894.1 hypothetical protein GCD22_02743 [Acidithiobacillus thiooxidans ATCC 19377]